MNRAPDVLANRERAHDFLRDALDDIDECLQDSKFITSSSLRGPGITLRFNLTHIRRMHCGAEVTESSTKKQHHLSSAGPAEMPGAG